MTMYLSAVCVKYVLFTFNLLFAITGIIFLSIGISVKAYYHDYEAFLDDQYFSVPNLLIAIGVIIFTISFFGCCGAFKENVCMIVTFSTLLILVFILELSAGIAGYVLKNETYSYLTQKLNNSMSHYSTVNKTEVTFAWDLIQSTFKCCGVNKPHDWEVVFQDKLPVSCCGPQIGAVGSVNCTLKPATETLYKNGCVTEFGNFISNHAYTLGSIGIAFAIIQLLGIILSCYLGKRMKNQDYQ